MNKNLIKKHEKQTRNDIKTQFAGMLHAYKKKLEYWTKKESLLVFKIITNHKNKKSTNENNKI